MDRRSYLHPSQKFSSEQVNAGDKRRSTWHPSQALSLSPQRSNDNTHVSPLKEFDNVQQRQDSNMAPHQLAHVPMKNQFLQQSTTHSNDFESEYDGTMWQPSHISTVNDLLELPLSTIEQMETFGSCEPIQLSKESAYFHSNRNSMAPRQIDSSPNQSIPQSTINTSILQNKAIQTSQQSTKNSDQEDVPKILAHQSVPNQSSQQSITREPIFDASNVNVQFLKSEVWEDKNIPSESPHGSNQFIRQSKKQNYGLDSKEFESPNEKHEFKSGIDPSNESHLLDYDLENLQNKSLLHKSTRQSIQNSSIPHLIIEHPTPQYFSSPSTRQSSKNEFMQQSRIGQLAHQSANKSYDDVQAFNSNRRLPYQLNQSMDNSSTQESMTDRTNRQSITNRVVQSFPNSPSQREFSNSKLHQPLIIMDEDTNMLNYEIWPEEVHRHRSPLNSTRQSMSARSGRHTMANRSNRQSGMNKSIRPSTISNYNTDNQISNNISQSYAMPNKLARQSFATKSIRPSTIEGCISQGKTLESNNEVPSFKSNQHSATNMTTRQSKVNNLGSDIEILESDDASFTSKPYSSNQLGRTTSMSTRQSTSNPSFRQSNVTRPTSQSMAHKSLRQSIGDQSNRQDVAPRLNNQSIIEEYNPRGLSYQDKASPDTLLYQPSHHSMSNRSTRQSLLNRHVQQLEVQNPELTTNGYENGLFFDRSPSKSNHQSVVNRSTRQSNGNKTTRQSTNIRSMRPSANDNQSLRIHNVNNEIFQSRQPKSNQVLQQSIEGLNFESQIFEDEIYKKKNREGLSQKSYGYDSTQPPTIINSGNHIPTGTSIVELGSYENDIELAQKPTTNRYGRQSQGTSSTRQTMKLRSIRPSIVDHQTSRNQMFENGIPQGRQSIANESKQEPSTINLDVGAHVFNNGTYPNQIPMEEKIVQQSQGDKFAQQSTDFRSAHQSRVANPNLELHLHNDEPNLIRQSTTFRSPRQSQHNKGAQQLHGNKLARQSVGSTSIRQPKINDHNIDIQYLEDDIQLSQSPYISSRQSMVNRLSLPSREDTLIQQVDGDKFIQVSTKQGIVLEPNYLNNENILKEEPIKSDLQSIENLSFYHPIDESLNYHRESQVHSIDPLYPSRQSMNEVQTSNKPYFDEHPQNQLSESEMSKLTSYSGDHFEPKRNSEESRLNMESTQNMSSPSRFVTLEVRSNVQKESLDKFLVGGWDSVTLKIPPEMHSLLHGIRNSLSSNNSNLDLEQHIANTANENDGHCSANIRILYSGLYNSNQEPTNNDLREQSQISHAHSRFDGSDCPSCNVEKEQSSVRFNIER
ncbi:hypothetical protein KC19_VG228100 [Ceratodon purpureus]|uniref:Uncharacterized protein n=1 Tax=Ceratodon purpureus TaxID=3225 RepID=A0A8T0HTF6_CERPU|nr:hypothetical protein KC19_VG228100 [Ceratodon purpureus]